MKLKLFAAAALLVLATGGAYAAADMKDCCQGKECCCDKMKDEDAGKADENQQHKH